jgi:hypothetical protein
MKFAITDPKKVNKLHAHARGLSDFHWAIIKVLVDTGCHPKNIYDVKVEGDVVMWRRVKNSKLCFARLNEGLSEAITIIHSRKRYTREWYSTHVREVAVRAGMSYISPQSLRKTHCYRLLKDGYVKEEVAQMMGCSERLISTTYSQIAPEDLMRIVANRKVE